MTDAGICWEEIPDDALISQVWLLIGLTGSEQGSLIYANGRIALHTNDRCAFDVPLSEVRDVEFPWYYFGGGVKFSIGADRYRLSFVRPENLGGHSSIFEGRQAGKDWKSVLATRT